MPTILLIEDNKMLRFANEAFLRKAGYNVLTAADGEEALNVANQSCPDLILLDMLLPKLSGESVLRHLKQNTKTAHIPVVVLSSLSQANAARLRADGAADFLEKSELVKSSQPLLLAIKRILDPMGAFAATPQITAPEASKSIPPVAS